MKLHRFIGDFDLNKKIIEIKNPENVKQIRGVLRLEIGENLILSNGTGKQVEAKITEMSKEKINCEVIHDIPINDPARKVNLYLAILKKDNFEIALEKAVECGVANIIPIITERTVKTGLNTTRLEKIIREASEQCERSIIPNLLPTMSFEQALKHGAENEEKIIFHPNNKQYIPQNDAKNISIFIGPEGGFSDKEITLAQNREYIVASLGTLILRGETASTIATYRAVQAI